MPVPKAHGCRVHSGNGCRDTKISLPPLQEQRRIAHILGTLDDKIELNRQMNETLEATARAIFKSWFVDFDPVKAKMEGQKTCRYGHPKLPPYFLMRLRIHR